MAPLRLNGSTSGYSQIDAPAVAGDQTFTLPGTGGTLDRLNRAGNVLQVVNATYGTLVTTTGNTYIDTGLSASITPSSTSSKILVVFSQADPYKTASASVNGGVDLRLLRDSTALITLAGANGFTGTNLQVNGTSISGNYLDSPATTSAVTYKTQFRNYTASNGTVGVQSAGGTSTITLMEIAA